MREILLGIMIILAIISFFKAEMCIDDRKLKGMLYIAILFFITGISILLNFTLLNQNDKLIEKTKNKCPEYQQVQNVYILKE
jgi:archaellum biogenesis protein FlaJ (TadC family)